MKVLIISRVAWNSSTNFGNTYSALFEGLQDVEIGHLYFANGKPDTKMVSRFFRIREKDVLKRLLGTSRCCGEAVEPREEGPQELGTIRKFGKKYRLTIFFAMRDMLFSTGAWKSKELKAFLDDFSPDVIFAPLYDNVYMHKIERYVAAYTQAPFFSFVSDDIYSLKQFRFSPIYWLYRLSNRRHIKKTVAMDRCLFVISEAQKREYEKAFHVPCKILTKSADFSVEPEWKESYGSPLQLVFTGNIGTNRWKSLALIANTLKRINANGVKMQLRIYTATPLTGKMQKALNVPETSFLMGEVAASRIPQIYKEADMLVHVEALDLKSKLAVRLSFSTKLVDYFKAARPILAVGPRGVASMAHLIDNACAVTAENAEMLYEKLVAVLDNPNQLTQLAKKAYVCGRKHHNQADMKAMLYKTLKEAAGE